MHQHAGASVDVHVVGWVLLAVGLVGILLSLLLWEPWGLRHWGWGRSPGPYDGPPGGYARRARRTVIEEEGPPAPPSADPYDVPPPP